MSSIERIMDSNELIAIIVRSEHQATGVDFITDNQSSQQLGLMGHPKGKVIKPHFHLPTERIISTTTETLIIKKGKLRVDFYREDRSVLMNRVLGPNDLIMIFRGGHGFEALEDLQMIEVKQGPYVAGADKVDFQGDRH